MTERAATGDGAITVYWRPGCGFCAALRARLRRARVDFDEVNIWEDPDAGAYVRSVAGGNETVPTVRIGRVGLVNPSLRAVLETAAEHAPQAVVDVAEPRSPLRALRSVIQRRKLVEE